MKRLFALLAALTTVLSLALLPVQGLDHAEWDATTWEDGNYDNFFGDEGAFHSDYVVDGGLATAWQKERGAMNAEGYFEKECFVALSWDYVMKIDSLAIWWRSSSRAQASPEGYVVQIGTGSGQDVTWSDVEANYAYNADEQDDGYFVCDTVTFAGEVEAMHLRILIKRGVDYVDPDRMYSPKVNELEVNADMSMNQPEETETPDPTETPSEDNASAETPTKEPAATPENSEAPLPTEAPAAKPSPTATLSPSDGNTSPVKSAELLPWYILMGVSAVVLLGSGIVLILNRNKE